MHTLVNRLSIPPIVFVLVFATHLAAKCSEASAAERPAPTRSHPASAGSATPVELGPSVEAWCKRTNDGIEYQLCESARDIVALMNAEPRDNAWADNTESDIAAWIQAQSSKRLTLRNVQCRSSFCIAEVGSPHGSALEPRIADQRKWRLFGFQSLFAPDVDDPNVQDQLIFYKRYCRSEGELFDGEGHLVPNFFTEDQKC